MQSIIVVRLRFVYSPSDRKERSIFQHFLGGISGSFVVKI